MKLPRIFSRQKRSDDPRGLPPTWSEFWYDMVDNAKRSTAGQRVNVTTAERIAAVYACKTAIAESVAMLPAVLFSEKDERTRTKLKNHPLWKILRAGPNEWADPFMFFEAMEYNVLDYGNAYAHVQRKKSGAIIRIIPLLPERMNARIVDGQLIYTYTQPNAGGPKEYSREEIFHLRYRSRDGLIGRSPIQVAAETYGYALALQEHGNRFFEHGAFNSGIVKAPFAFKDEDTREAFMASVNKFAGARNAGKNMLLEQGVDYAPMTQSNREAQFIDSHKFSVEDIARIYRVPPIVIQVTAGGMSYASVEQLLIYWIQGTIQPHATRWEHAIKKQLLFDVGEEDAYVRFNISALIRGDLKSRTESIIQQLQYGLKTINEARVLLDENAIDPEVGDEVFLSHNLVPASQVIKGEVQAAPGAFLPQSDEKTDENTDEMPKKEAKTDENQDDLEDEEEENERNFIPLFESLMSRVVRKEQKAVDAAVKKPDFMKRMERFYSEHGEMFEETVRPALRSFGVEDKFEEFRRSYFDARTESIIRAGTIPDDSAQWAGRLCDLIKGD